MTVGQWIAFAVVLVLAVFTAMVGYTAQHEAGSAMPAATILFWPLVVVTVVIALVLVLRIWPLW